jgi:hypothetical protein
LVNELASHGHQGLGLPFGRALSLFLLLVEHLFLLRGALWHVQLIDRGKDLLQRCDVVGQVVALPVVIHAHF